MMGEVKIERSFKGIWIPKEVWLSNDISITEKVFLAEIDSLDNEDGCFASNDYFAEFFGLSKNRCSEIIKGLEKKSYITTEYLYKENTKAIERRIIKIIQKTTKVVEKPNRGVVEKPKGGYSENCEDITKPSFNNNIYSIFNCWNDSNAGIKHRSIKNFEAPIKKALKKYSCEEIIIAIKRLALVLNSTNNNYGYKWNLKNWISRDTGIENWLDEGQTWNNHKDKVEPQRPKTNSTDGTSTTPKIDEEFIKKLKEQNRQANGI